jgi:hypothetical protein
MCLLLCDYFSSLVALGFQNVVLDPDKPRLSSKSDLGVSVMMDLLFGSGYVMD